MIITWDNAFGVFALFAMAYAGMMYFEDSKVRIASLGLGISLAALLAGLDPTMVLKGFQGYMTSTANQAGIITSSLALSMTPMLPLSSVRKTTMGLGATGIATSLMGFPSWIIWVIVASVLIALGIASYKVIMKALDIINYKINHMTEAKMKA